MKSDWPVNPPRPSDVNHPKGVKMMKNEIKWKTFTHSLFCKGWGREEQERSPGAEEKNHFLGAGESRTSEKIFLSPSLGFLWK